MVRDYLCGQFTSLHGHLAGISTIFKICQAGKFQGVNRLKLLIIVYNLIEELHIMDKILGNVGCPQSPQRYYIWVMQEISKTYFRVSTAKKYKDYDHYLSIVYKPVKKGDNNA